ncbi:MaoC-like dehydratase [hydrothermal vent metagenome]|uniref:MaoC-like dehydratase n=1 Tax=hydrothermal vent metagenome TaxID=652676 RepID=A0A3B0TDL8_9ZZZZ
MSKFFEDMRIGEQAVLGSHTFTEEQIITFARRYDPQPFHTDTETAGRSFYGGLIASGWHSAAICMRLWVGYIQAQQEAAALAPGERQPRLGPSPGIRALAWRLPVRAGDTISYSTRVTEKTELRSRPQWGLVVSRFTGVNQHGREAISYEGQVFVERRGGGQRA